MLKAIDVMVLFCLIVSKFPIAHGYDVSPVLNTVLDKSCTTVFTEDSPSIAKVREQQQQLLNS